MPDGKWVSKANLQTFWQMIRSNIASFVTNDVIAVLPTFVPEELNKVLPTMVGEQIDNKFGDDIGDNVTSWLTEHVTPAGSAVVVDDTLTIQGAAADAKKTGDEISGLKEDLSESVGDLKSALEYNIDAIQEPVAFSHSETISANTSHTYYFPSIIYAGTKVAITNLSASTMTVNLVKADGTEQNVSALIAGQTKIYTLAYDCIGMRNYVGGTSWNFTVAFGGEIPKLLSELSRELKTQGALTDNIFSFDNSFADSVTNGLNIIRKNSNTIILNGTATSAFNINFSFQGFSFPTDKKLYHIIETSADSLQGCYLSLGFFNTDSGPEAISATVTQPNQYVIYSYPARAVSSRFYFHVENGASFNNVELTFFVASASSILVGKLQKLSDDITSLNGDIDRIDDRLEYELTTNKFKISEGSTTVANIAYTKLNDFQCKLNGTSNSEGNINISFGVVSIPKERKIDFLLKTEGTAYTDSDIYLQLGYFKSDSTAVQMSTIVKPNERITVTFPTAAATLRAYIHIASGKTFTNEIVSLYAYYYDSRAEDRLEAKINGVVGNLEGNSFNSTYHDGLTGYATPCGKFAALMSGDTVNDVSAVKTCEAFLFFTDPHTQHDPWSSHFVEYMGQIQKVFRSSPAYFALCGGDWLGNSDTPDKASYKMGLIGAACRSMLNPCYMLVGNHDTNYQGKKDASSATSTTRLPNESISNLWYAGKKAYYTFEGMNTKFYCFDTGTEGQQLTDFNSYGYEQCLWFANALKTDNTEHIAIALHIFYENYNNLTWSTIAHLVMQIAAAYNTRGSITVNGETFDYEDSKGFIEFAIAGHLHSDQTLRFTESGADIPVIVTKDVGKATTFPTDATFDLVFVDYDNREIECIRVGDGEDRTISLAEYPDNE